MRIVPQAACPSASAARFMQRTLIGNRAREQIARRGLLMELAEFLSRISHRKVAAAKHGAAKLLDEFVRRVRRHVNPFQTSRSTLLSY